MIKRIEEWLNASGRTEVLGVMRIAIGCLLFTQAFDAFGELQRVGYFGDNFHMPLIADRFVATRAFYTYMLTARLILAVIVALGIQARPALFLSSLMGIYVLLCDKLEFHHNRYALLLYAFILALTPCDKSWRLNGRRQNVDQVGPMWGVWLGRLQVSIIYLGSGGSKLFDPDWRDGTMVAQRFVRYGHEAIDKGVPQFFMDFLATPLMTGLIAKGAIFSELFIAFGLQFKRTRRAALWWGMIFHLMIETTSAVELFTYVTLVAYAFFVTPDVGARKFEFDGSRWQGKFLGRTIRLLDWFSRFEVSAWSTETATSKHLCVLTRREGTRVTGLDAWAGVAEATPLLFLAWAPTFILAGVLRRRAKA
ncbi:MAG: HTTM domain-containing protein [Polyangiaceae bacterium]